MTIELDKDGPWSSPAPEDHRRAPGCRRLLMDGRMRARRGTHGTLSTDFCRNVQWCDMGFIESHKADCMLSVLIATHLLMAARETGRSSGSTSPPRRCVYNAD